MTSATLRILAAGVLAVGLTYDPAPAWAQARQVQRDPKPARTRVLRTWDDTIKQDGQDVARHVTIVFDYNAGIAWEYAYDSSGQQISSRQLVSNPPTPSLDEIADVIAIIRADAELGRIVARTSAHIEGGFLLEEGKGEACGPRTRCIQVLLMAKDSMGLLRRVVVDLTKNAVAYASYVPKDGKAGKQ